MHTKLSLKQQNNIKDHTKRLNTYWWLLVIAGIFGFIFLLNVLTPMIADDFSYQFTIGQQPNTKISSFTDIINSQIYHYLWWGGRSVVHCIVQALLMLPPILSDFLNSMVFIAYILLIYLLIRGREKNSISIFLLVFFAVWFFQPAIGDTILWITGSGNYLWGTVLILLFILPYRFYSGKNNKSSLKYVYTLLFLIYGIISGWTNENSAGAMILLSILFIANYKINKWSIPQWAISGIIGAIIGYLFMILAPGNMVRAGESMPLDIQVFAFRFIMHTKDLVYNCGIVLILYIFFVFLLLKEKFNIKNIPSSIQISLMFMLAMLASVYAMVISPSFPPRAWFGTITFLIIGAGIAFYSINDTVQSMKGISKVLVCIVTIGFIFSTYDAFKDINTCRTTMVSRDMKIREAKRNNATSVEVDRFRSQTKFTHVEDNSATSSLSLYYGIDVTFND